jgi:hypothetical protein
MKRGRKPLLERYGITVQELYELYLEEGTIRALAKRLKCSPTTVEKYLKGIKKDPTPWKLKGKQVKSLITEWLKENPDHVLPSSAPELARLTGIDKKSAYHYLNLRRTQYQRRVKEALDQALLDRTRIWEDLRGRKIPGAAFAKVRVNIPHKLVPIVDLEVVLRDGTETQILFYPKKEWDCQEHQASPLSASTHQRSSPAQCRPDHEQSPEPESYPEQRSPEPDDESDSTMEP